MAYIDVSVVNSDTVEITVWEGKVKLYVLHECVHLSIKHAIFKIRKLCFKKQFESDALRGLKLGYFSDEHLLLSLPVSISKSAPLLLICVTRMEGDSKRKGNRVGGPGQVVKELWQMHRQDCPVTSSFSLCSIAAGITW